MELTLSWGALPAQEPTAFPQEARDRFDKARELQRKGKLLEAIQAYQDAIGLGMQAFPRAHLYQADASLQLKQYDEAIARYGRFLDRFSIDDSCRY
jgi:tetratricopeptide (TPR) repeat protein